MWARERLIPIGACSLSPMFFLIGNPGRLALQEARVLMTMGKRKPSMFGAPRAPLHVMTPERRCRMAKTSWL